jgi:hypothetical protein
MADEVVTDGEDDRGQEREAEPDPLHVLRPTLLADEEDAPDHDQDCAADHAGLRRLVEQEQRDRDREERRGTDGDRRPRRSRVAHREREQQLRASRTEDAREQERPDAADLDVVHGDEGKRDGKGREDRPQRPGLGIRRTGEREPDRDRHRPEERGRGEREHDRVH